ncbi:hypothetical protein CFP65_1666 [Kitasatospora sp. MMS16-BH015]|uniref:ABC transporter permease n=1 Tax=Kitasatospora sp. MMS16-BH015 TaxID=2018025 RepID=UPI000CA2F11C|nr:ABC transporter permease [Kitasatospora sp. MMS16-BH015]AUG76549.1 hypothetical protein CFP65_1666 [Kitasatospora sp. MMS16-BH015]
MSAVWRAARAAVRRRRLQTVVIGFVVLVSTATLVVALGLLSTAAGPFDQAFARQDGAHLTTAFDAAKVTDEQLAATAKRPGVTAAAGPYGLAMLEIHQPGDDQAPPITLATVGRASAQAPVDRIEVWSGHWPTGPGQILVRAQPGQTRYTLGGTVTPTGGGPALTVVGLASSVGWSADAWVTPGELAALHPTDRQMLYRLAAHDTDAQLRAGLADLTAALPAEALTGSQQYLAVRNTAEGSSGTFVPFLVLFGVLGLVVAVLIVGSVVSGAVVAGFRHIGVLKAIGFTPAQVVAVYLVMVSVPAAAGAVLGTGLGDLLAQPILSEAYAGFGSATTSVSPWVDLAALLGMPALAALAALLPAQRARTLSVSQAISAGSAPRAGRGLRAQRLLAGTRLPRPLSLGMGLVFARPGRSAMTLGAVALGVLSVTVSTGFTLTLQDYSHAATRRGSYQLGVIAQRGYGPPGSVAATLSDSAVEQLIRGLPGVTGLSAKAVEEVRITGQGASLMVDFARADSPASPWPVLAGRWLDGPGQVEVNGDFLYKRGLRVGDSFTMAVGDRQVPVVIAGEVLATGMDRIYSNWSTLQLLDPAKRADAYEVSLAPGTDAGPLATRIRAADPGLLAFTDTAETQSSVVVMSGTAGLLSLLLGLVAAMGIFNTVVLNTRERRRDLGVLKSIGMTPRQVVGMTVASMATLGLLGGLLGVPLGVLCHRLLAGLTSRAAHVTIPAPMLRVYSAPLLLGLGLAGVLIAVLGALLPARRAARLTIAQVLHNE